ncbi:MAG: acetyl-CoA carboxylase biotin carboxyl carrier protein [Candidatus Xenobium sp.]|jgi:acetyl-CoA carboxylase biotin carboxyl carrier protein
MKDKLEMVRSLARVLREEGLIELEYENEDLKVRLSAERQAPAADPRPLATVPPAAPAAEAPGASIPSLLAGVFYRAPSPGAPPFVQDGETVACGQTVCIVEAMKQMNEIKAEASCRILRALVDDGQVVQAGQPLFGIERL